MSPSVFYLVVFLGLTFETIGVVIDTYICQEIFPSKYILVKYISANNISSKIFQPIIIYQEIVLVSAQGKSWRQTISFREQ